MAINPEHVKLYSEAFEFLGMKLPPEKPHALIIGVQDILPNQKMFVFPSVKGLFMSWGFEKVVELDYYDPRADWHLNLNDDLGTFFEKFDLVFDIGTLEHIANSQMALQNYLSALKTGGYLFLLTPCKGYFDHGLHTFSPEYILETLKLNGCTLEKIWYILPEWSGGDILGCIDQSTSFPSNEAFDQAFNKAIDVLIVVIAKLAKPFIAPIKAVQQQRWLKTA